jgi:hypothetical protein
MHGDRIARCLLRRSEICQLCWIGIWHVNAMPVFKAMSGVPSGRVNDEVAVKLKL